MVSEKLVVSMLMLGHHWPLAQVLGDHFLVDLINRYHQRQREAWKQPDSQLAEAEEDSLDSDSDTTSASKDDDRDLTCTGCGTDIAKVRHTAV